MQHLGDQKVLELLGERFMAARLNQNLSRESLANKTGLTEKTISNLEKGRKSVGLLNVIAILRALGLLDEIDNFIPEPPLKAAALISRKKMLAKPRQRASREKVKAVDDKGAPWQWGEE